MGLRRIMLAGGLAVVAAAGTASELTPRPVVERTVTVAERNVRLSLFDNGEAVVVLHEGDHVTSSRRLRLTPQEMTVYRNALDSEARKVERRNQSRDTHDVGGWATVTLYRQDGVVQTFGYSPMFGVSLTVGRLTTVLDDIERRVVEHEPDAASVRAWQPAVGDRVELMDGPTAVVESIGDGGEIVLCHDRSPLVETVAPVDVVTRIRRILEVQ